MTKIYLVVVLKMTTLICNKLVTFCNEKLQISLIFGKKSIFVEKVLAKSPMV